MSLYDDLQANAPAAKSLDPALTADRFAAHLDPARDRGATYEAGALRHAEYDRSYFTTMAPFRVQGLRVEVIRQEEPSDSLLIGVITDRSFEGSGQEVHLLVDNLVSKSVTLLTPRQMELAAEAAEAGEGEKLSQLYEAKFFGDRAARAFRVSLPKRGQKRVEVIFQNMSLFHVLVDLDAEAAEREAAEAAGEEMQTRTPVAALEGQTGRFLGLDDRGDLVGWVKQADGAGELAPTPVEAIFDQTQKGVFLGGFPLGAFRKKAREGSRLYRIPMGALPNDQRTEEGAIMNRVVLRTKDTSAPHGQGAFQLLRKGPHVFWWRLRRIDDTRMVGSVVCLGDDLQEVSVRLNGPDGPIWQGGAILDDPQDLNFHRRRNSFEIEADIPAEVSLTFRVKKVELTTDMMAAEGFRR